MEKPQDRTEFTAQVLQPLFAAIWEEKQLPDDCTGVIVKILRKGTLSNCNNWWGVTFLSVPSKILAKLIIRQISEALNQQLRQEQAGFQKGWGCADQIFTLCNIIEQCTERQRQLYINYVEFDKAFNRIHLERTTTSSAEWETAKPALVWRPVLDKNVPCQHCSSTWWLTDAANNIKPL